MIKFFATVSNQIASFTSRRQSIGEPALKYIHAMQALVVLDDKSFTDEFVFAVIRDGLLPDVRDAIKLHKPKDLASLKDLCIAYDSSSPEEMTCPIKLDASSEVLNSEIRELREEVNALKDDLANMNIGVNIVRTHSVATSLLHWQSGHDVNAPTFCPDLNYWSAPDGQYSTEGWGQDHGEPVEHLDMAEWSPYDYGEYPQDSGEWWSDDHFY